MIMNVSLDDLETYNIKIVKREKMVLTSVKVMET